MTEDREDGRAARGSYVVAVVLAIGICTALNLITVAILYDAIVSAGPGISENATQILTGWGGGVIGVIGAVVGYGAGHNAATNEAERTAAAIRDATPKPPPS